MISSEVEEAIDTIWRHSVSVPEIFTLNYIHERRA